MWNQNLWWERSPSKILKHTGPNVSLWNRAAWAQPLAGSHCFAVLLHILLLSIRSFPAIGQCIARPCQYATNYQWDTCWYFSCSAIGKLHIGPYLMIPVNEGPLGKWFSQETVLHWSSDPYLWTNYYFLFVCFNRECISGRWCKLSFPTQYESSSVPNNISGGDIYDFLGSDV